VTAVFWTSDCVASAAAAADCSLVAGAEVSATVAASAFASAWFSWETCGPLPGLSTRTSTFVLPTPCCCAFAPELAACATEAPCSPLCPGAAALFPGPGSLCPGAEPLDPRLASFVLLPSGAPGA